MMVYLKNMANYKMKYFKGMSYDQIRPIFEEEYRKVQTLFKKDSKVTFSSRKITEEPKELSEEDLKKMLEIVLVEEFRVEALQTKVGNIIEAYQGFEDMLKAFDREDLDTLWSLVKEKFRFAEPTEDMEKALWIVSLVGPAGDPWDQRVRSQVIGKDLVSGLLVYKSPLSSIRKKYSLSLKNDMPPRDKLEEERARRCGKVYNWETAKYDKIWYDEDVHDLRSIEIEFPAIVFNDELSSEKTLSCQPTVSSLNNNEIDFRISFDESDDEDYTPTVSYFDDLDFLKDFKNEFPVIVYNDALTSKSDSLTEHVEISHHIDEFNLKTKTSLSECDEEEQNVLYFNDLFLFNIIYPHDLESDTDNDDNEIDII
ncbi:hypothetical protein Tco_1176762 [Tanacetum coccineum]